MNCAWPASITLRSSCRYYSRSPILQLCENVQIHPFSKLAPRPSCIRPYTIFSTPCWRRRDVSSYSFTALRGERRRNQIIRFASTSTHDETNHAAEWIVTEFAQLPENYSDDPGLPFRISPLNKEEVLGIFGEETSAGDANRLLRVIHGRRVAGTLEDPSLPDLSAEYESRAVDTALQWLRDNVPVNEVVNAGLRAERELAEMEGEVLERAERLGIYTPNAQDKPGKAGTVYGKGAFDRMRERQKKESEEMEARRKREEEEMTPNTGLPDLVGNAGERFLESPGESPWMLYYKEQAQITADDVAPKMSAFARLWPSGVLLLFTLSGCYLLAEVYEPPTPGTRLWPDIPASAATMITIIALNTALFCAWRIPPFWRTMNKYFIQVPAYPFAFSLIGNIFSHQTVKHLGLNMLVIYLFGTRLHEEIGRGHFLAVYMASGAFGSFLSLTSRVVGNSFITSSLGASGALCGIVGCYLLLHSDEKVTLFGVFPPEDWPSISSLMLLALLVGVDIAGLVRKRSTPKSIDHMAHLGGFATGIGSALAIREEVRMRKRKEAERRRNRGLMEQMKQKRF